MQKQLLEASTDRSAAIYRSGRVEVILTLTEAEPLTSPRMSVGP